MYLRFSHENKHLLRLVRHDRPDYGVVYDAYLVLSALPRGCKSVARLALYAYGRQTASFAKNTFSSAYSASYRQ